MSEIYSTKGKHIIADFFGIKNNFYLDDEAGLIRIFKAAIQVSRATLIDMMSYKFTPHGITLVGILSESSFDCHTYPEHNFMSVSLYTCGSEADPERGIRFISKLLKPNRQLIRRIERGDESIVDKYNSYTNDGLLVQNINNSIDLRR